MDLEYAKGKFKNIAVAISKLLSPENDELLHNDIYNDYIDELKTHLRSFYKEYDTPFYDQLKNKLNQGERDWDFYDAKGKLERLHAFIKTSVLIDIENRIHALTTKEVRNQSKADELAKAILNITQERDKLKKQFEGCKTSYEELLKERDKIASEVSNLKATLSAEIIIHSQKSDTQEKKIKTLEFSVEHTKQEALKWNLKADELQKQIAVSSSGDKNTKYKLYFYISLFVLSALVLLTIPLAFKKPHHWKNIAVALVLIGGILTYSYKKETAPQLAAILSLLASLIGSFEF
jgi:regulator of replication initiation timing